MQCPPVSFIPYKTPTIPYILYSKGEARGSYVSDVIKSEHKETNKQEINQRITARWGPRANHSLINTRVTKKGTNQGMKPNNHLDGSKYKEQSWRIKLLTGTVPVKSLITSWDKYSHLSKTCDRCNAADETAQHLMNCEKTKEKLEDLKDLAVKIMIEKKQTQHDYKNLKEVKEPAPPHYLLSILGINDGNFLDSPTAQGIITETLLEKFKTRIPNRELPKNTILTDWILWALDGWLSAAYILIWKDRNKITMDPVTGRR